MAEIKLVKAVPVSLKGHPQLDERWVQQQITSDPTILGLGDVYVRDQERIQPRAGRLDLLLQSTEDEQRYEVEIQLGPTDESHIIRVIEYWDIERRRYPQYNHCAVLVAEDITSRFLNIIQLLNGQVPLIAIQMRALAVADGVCLTFTKVIDELRRGLVDEDEEASGATDRTDWESRGLSEFLQIVDGVFAVVRRFAPNATPNYLKHYVGAKVDGRSNNFIAMSPRKKGAQLGLRLPQSSEVERQIEQAGLILVGYKSWGAYDVRLSLDDVRNRDSLLEDLLKRAFEYWSN